MLIRYNVDVSGLTEEQISNVYNQLEKYSFSVFPQHTNSLHIKCFDVYLSDSYNFDEVFSLPPKCKVTRLA